MCYSAAEPASAIEALLGYFSQLEATDPAVKTTDISLPHEADMVNILANKAYSHIQQSTTALAPEGPHQLPQKISVKLHFVL